MSAGERIAEAALTALPSLVKLIVAALGPEDAEKRIREILEAEKELIRKAIDAEEDRNFPPAK